MVLQAANSNTPLPSTADSHRLLRLFATLDADRRATLLCTADLLMVQQAFERGMIPERAS